MFFFLSPSFAPFIVAEGDKLKYLVRTHDLSVSRELFARGGFDDFVLPRAMAILEHYGYQTAKNQCFVDIGANMGTSVISAVNTIGFSKGIAFEPDPTNHLLIQVNALLNGIADRVTAHKLALSDADGNLEFELSPENSGDNRVRLHGNAATGPELHSESQRPTIRVEATTFDRLLDRGILNLAEIGIIWMDTQGHEAHVLAGASRLLQSDIPIVMEYWPYALQRAGGLERLERLIAEHYTHFLDIREQTDGVPPRATPVSELHLLRDKYPHVMLTDLLLTKRAGKA